MFMALFKPRSPVMTFSLSEACVDSGFREWTGQEWWPETEGWETALT